MNDEKDKLFGWESDFWRDLMEETHITAPGGFSYVHEEPAKVFGHPDPFFYANHKDMFGDPHYGGAVETYWTPDTLVGEIVEDGPLELST